VPLPVSKNEVIFKPGPASRGDVEVMLTTLQKSFEEFSVQQENFLLVFLFGSFARGFGTDESDVDVAIMFKKVPDFFGLSDLKDQLSCCAGKEVDIVTLNTASPIIRMQVLRYGLLVKKDKTAYNDFFVSTLREYYDLKCLRKEIEENLLKGRIYA
jgi:predicted nucleotidyltransferase